MSLLKVCLLLVIAVAGFAQDTSEDTYQAIRNDDLVALRALTRDGAVNTKDSAGQTPLMFAAAFGSLDAMKLLIANGADAKAASNAGITALHWATGDVRKIRLLLENGAAVNESFRSSIGRTPLLVAAGTNGTLESVRLLMENGTDVNAADNSGMTPLIAAAGVDNADVARLLIEKGAHINAQASSGTAPTALMESAKNGNADLTRLLLAHNADVHLISSDELEKVANGPVAFGHVIALHLAVSSGSADTVKLLLNAGSPVNARDIRGMTPLMFAVSTDRPNVDIVRMLLAKGADVSIRSTTNETTVDWARKFNDPAVLAALKLKAETVSASISSPLIPDAKGRTPQQAVERSLPLLETAAANVFSNSGCIACHAQPIAKMAVDLASARGWKIDDVVRKTAASESARAISTLAGNLPALMQGREGSTTPDAQLYRSMMMITSGEPASRVTDMLVHYLAAKQRMDGYWQGDGPTRAPIEDGNVSRTAMGIRTLATYGMPGRKSELAERIARAANWIAKQTPLSTEDRVMQILGLRWANTRAPGADKRTKELIGIQRSDGGWAQTPYLASDAYATGQVLYTLHEMGVPSSDPVFRRGAEFLTRSQKEDGSWYVKSRAMKIQPYFESGFPHGHDQWISSSATAWAIMALSFTAPDTPAR